MGNAKPSSLRPPTMTWKAIYVSEWRRTVSHMPKLNSEIIPSYLREHYRVKLKKNVITSIVKEKI